MTRCDKFSGIQISFYDIKRRCNHDQGLVRGIMHSSMKDHLTLNAPPLPNARYVSSIIRQMFLSLNNHFSNVQ